MPARKKARAPIKLRWFEALRKFRDIPRDSPSGQAVIAVSGVLMGYADPDGRNCYPSIHTIMQEARASERTVVLVLAWLIEHGWLVVTRRVSRRPTIYRLTIPVPAEEQVPDDGPYLPTSRYHESPVPAVVPAVVPADGQEDSELRTDSEEEEEGAIARSTDAALAAPVSDPAAGGVDLARIVEYISRHTGRTVSPTPALGQEIVKAKERTGWNDGLLAAYCVEKLRSRGQKVAMPPEFLSVDLRDNVGEGIVPSVRVVLASFLWGLSELDERVEASGYDMGLNDPMVRVEQQLIDADLVNEDGVVIPDVWDAKAVKADVVEKFSFVVCGVLIQVRRHLDALDAYERPAYIRPCPGCGAANAPSKVMNTPHGVMGSFECLSCGRGWESDGRRA